MWNFSLYKFSDFLEKIFCHCSLSCQFFCHQAICIHSLLHPQPNIFIWKMLGHIWCADTNDLLGQKFPTEDPAVCSLLLPLLWESGNECVGFSLHKWKVLPSPKFRHEKVVLFTLSGQFLGWFTLRLSFEAVQRSSLPSFYLYLLFPTACLTFNFSSLLIIPQNPIKGAQGKFKLQKIPNIVWVAQLFRGLTCRYKPISLPLTINRGHFFQTCPTASTTWLHVAVIMKV